MTTFPQFRLPLQMSANGALTVLETGAATEIGQRARVLCSTDPGEIDDEPTFGLADQPFRKGGADIAEIKHQLDSWIPEAAAVVERDPDALAESLDLVGVMVAGS